MCVWCVSVCVCVRARVCVCNGVGVFEASVRPTPPLKTSVTSVAIQAFGSMPNFPCPGRGDTPSQTPPPLGRFAPSQFSSEVRSLGFFIPPPPEKCMVTGLRIE